MINPVFQRFFYLHFLLSALCLFMVSCSTLDSALESFHQPELYKSETDTRDYRLIELENRLRVLLVSDPQAQKAAAAMDVAVGSSADPQGRDGLAHFLEHMLFLGTEKYPKPGDYQDYIAAHGGRHNAYTAFEHTNYFFDIAPDYFPEALDRFAQFFIAPLFTESYVEREKNAVHSEYQAGYKNDYRRSYDAIRQIINPEHPFSKFSVGSLKTLGNGETNVRDELITFYQQHYSANTMRLVVMGKQSLDDLEGMVRERFNSIPDRELVVSAIETPLFTSGVLPARISIVPETDMRQLSVLFPIADLKSYYREKPVAYISNLIGHEGKGSLLSALKKRGWAEGLSAGQGLSYNGGASFDVSISLTEQGLQHTDEIVGLLFQNINRIRQNGLAAWRYEEQSQLASLQFRFQEKGEPVHTVSQLALAMHDYDPREVLRGPYLMQHYDQKLIKQFLDSLTAQNCLVKLISKSAKTTQQSAWYSTPYSVEKIDQKVIASWQAVGINDDKERDEILLPGKNLFVPQKLTIQPLVAEHFPQQMKAATRFRWWHHPNDRFEVPRSSLYFSVRSAKAADTPADAALLNLYVALLRDALNEYTYPAYLAGLQFDISKHARGFSVRINGYSEKQAQLMSAILQQLQNRDFDEARFSNLKQELMRGWRNASKLPPYQLLAREVRTTLFEPHWTEEELLGAIETQQMPDLQKLLEEFWVSVSIDCLVSGNTDLQQAENIATQLKGMLPSAAGRPALPELQVAKLESSERVLRQIATEHNDAGLMLYVQGRDNSVQEQAILALTAQIVATPFYQQLRTEQQLGYVVWGSYMPLLTVPGLAFVVQSPGHDEAAIHKAITKFLTEFSQDVAGLSPQQFSENKQAVIHQLLDRPKNQEAQTEEFWAAIAMNDLGFDHKKRVAAAVEKITLQEWQSVYQPLLLSKDSRMLLLQTQPKTIDASGFDSFTIWDQVRAFKQSHDTYRYP